jgi:hypothetical protein
MFPNPAGEEAPWDTLKPPPSIAIRPPDGDPFLPDPEPPEIPSGFGRLPPGILRPPMRLIGFFTYEIGASADTFFCSSLMVERSFYNIGFLAYSIFSGSSFCGCNIAGIGCLFFGDSSGNPSSFLTYNF